MRGAPKLTAAELRRWRDPCPRKGCDGYLCSVALDVRYGYQECNDCHAVVRYYAGVNTISKREYERAVTRAEEKRRRVEARTPSSYGYLVEEEIAMTKVKAKGKAVKKGSKKAKKVKTAKPKAKTGKVTPPREGTLGAFVVAMIRDGASIKETSKAAVKKFPNKKSALPAGVSWYAWRHGAKVKAKK